MRLQKNGLALFAATTAFVLTADNRPYEFVDANRTQDEVAPLVDFESESGWSVASAKGGAQAYRSQDRQLFGEWTLAIKLGRGETVLRPAAPIAIGENGFDTFGVWIFASGNVKQGGTSKAYYPSTWLVFVNDAGEETRLPLTVHTAWYDWFWLMKRFTANELKQIAGKKFNGFAFRAINAAAGWMMFMDNIAFFRDDLSGKLDLKPVDPKELGIPTRPEGALPASSVAGSVNTVVTNGNIVTLTYEGSDGKLVYKWNRAQNTPHTLTAQWNDETVFYPMCEGGTEGSGKADWRVGIRGKTLVMEVSAPAGKVTKINYGHSDCASAHIKVPMYWRNRVDLTGSTFSHVFSDWYVSQASIIHHRWELPGTGLKDCSIYKPKTDGTYNEVYERLYLTVSPTFIEVMPSIANPVSPWKHVTGSHAWTAYASTADRERDKALWRRVRALGIKNVVINDHEVCFRDDDESFTFRLKPAPAKGGEKGLRDWAHFLIDELGYYYGPYNNFTDFAPVNANWSRDRASRNSDGSLGTAWRRCYSPKPLYGLEKCREYTPILKERFGFNTAYCDVHTFFGPWQRTDYDARTPGAAKFSTTYYAYLAILDCQRKTWKGPVYSEGFHHALYAGVVDGNYAQARHDPMADPWIVDFNLLKIHPLECDFGVGNLNMWNGNKRALGTLDGQLDYFIAAELAFGSAPFLAVDYLWDPPLGHGPAYGGKNAKFIFEEGAPRAMRSYFMVLELAKRYTQQAVVEIRYADAAGRLETTSDAIRSGAAKRNQILVRYADGTCTVSNGSLTDRLRTRWQGRDIDLPPTGYCGWTADGQVEVISTDDGKGRYDYAVTPEYVFYDGRGHERALPRASGKGAYVRYREGNDWKEVSLP